jgi:hypothetical protein
MSVHTQLLPIIEHITPLSAGPASLPPSGGPSMRVGHIPVSALLVPVQVTVMLYVGGQVPPPLLDPLLEPLLEPLLLPLLEPLLLPLLDPLLEPLLEPLLLPLLEPPLEPLPLLFEQATTDEPPAAAITPPKKSSAPRPILDDFIFDTSHE